MSRYCHIRTLSIIPNDPEYLVFTVCCNSAVGSKCFEEYFVQLGRLASAHARELSEQVKSK